MVLLSIFSKDNIHNLKITIYVIIMTLAPNCFYRRIRIFSKHNTKSIYAVCCFR